MPRQQCARHRAIATIPFLLILLAVGGLPPAFSLSAGAAEVSARLKVGLKIVPRIADMRRRMPVPPLPRPRPPGLAKR